MRVLPFLLLALLVAACGDAEQPADYVARVGESYLTQEQLDQALANLPAGQDTSAAARQQVIEQWVTSELLYQEALRRGLRDDASVQRLLRENERSVLVSALVGSLYVEEDVAPSAAELRAYFDRQRQQLVLREPYVQVRLLAHASADSVQRARQLLQEATVQGRAEATWRELVRRFAAQPGEAQDLAAHFYPESRLFAPYPNLQRALARLSPNQLTPVLQRDSLYVLLQLVERAPAGSVPRLEWIEDELRDRVLVQNRKQMYARQVERLKTEARARDLFEVR